MTHSSGRDITTVTRHVECDGYTTYRHPMFSDGPTFERTRACIFAGDVDITVDPETMWAGWDCPLCNTGHEVTWDDIVSGVGA